MKRCVSTCGNELSACFSCEDLRLISLTSKTWPIKLDSLHPIGVTDPGSGHLLSHGIFSRLSDVFLLWLIYSCQLSTAEAMPLHAPSVLMSPLLCDSVCVSVALAHMIFSFLSVSYCFLLGSVTCYVSLTLPLFQFSAFFATWTPLQNLPFSFSVFAAVPDRLYPNSQQRHISLSDIWRSVCHQAGSLQRQRADDAKPIKTLCDQGKVVASDIKHSTWQLRQRRLLYIKIGLSHIGPKPLCIPSQSSWPAPNR